MADLQPNTALLQPLQQSGGLGNLSLGDLLSLTARSRELQTQSAVSDALRASGGDPAQAKGMMMQPGAPGFVSPQTVTDFTNAEAAQAHLQKHYANTFAETANAVLTKPGKLTTADVIGLALQGERTGMLPKGYSTEFVAGLPNDDKSLRTFVANMHNYITGNADVATRQVQTPAGTTQDQPAATSFYPRGGGPQAPSAPGVTTSSIPGAATNPTASSAAYTTDQVRATGYNQEVYPLKAVIHAFETGAESGKGSEAYNAVNNFLHYAGIDKKFGLDTSQQTVPYETAHKYMVQWANTVSAAGTNDRLAAAISGNPNMTLQSGTNMVVAKASLALRRMQQVQYDEFNRLVESGQATPQQYTSWAAQWNKQQDSRAYAFDLMGRDAAEKMLKGMKPQERARFDASLSSARRSGLQEGNL